MASSKFRKVQVGHQSAFGTAVAPTIQLPMTGTYEDKSQVHVAEYDAGTWTPTTIVAKVASETAMTLEGTAFFEVLPVLLSSGLEAVTASGTPPAAVHTYTISPAAIATPKPLTALVGAVGTNIGGTGPAVKLKDLYLKKLTLSGNINDKVVMVKAELFGTTYDPNTADAGFAFETVSLIPTMEMINSLKGTLKIEDVTTTGWSFGGLTAFSCAMFDWEWELGTGIEPSWCQTDNVMTWAGLKYTAPSCTFKPIIRTSATNYALIKTKSDARTYQELQYVIAGSDATRSLTLNMTGRWDVVPTVHDDQDGELVMKPTFLVETPHTQTTTPHWMVIVVNSNHIWV